MAKINILFTLLFLGMTLSLDAYIDPSKIAKKNTNNVVSNRADCTPATAQIDMDINNVRARLLNGGDVWWDFQNGSYFVPKSPIGSNLPEVSSIFAGAVWLGGLDPAGNLKIAAVQYRGGSGNNTDYYSGPIDPVTGLTDKEICDDWDRFFRVYGEEIKASNVMFAQDGEVSESQLADNVKYWPAKGNPFFLERYQFELPSTGQGLGSFWDEDQDGQYNPTKGDFPIIEIRGCEPNNRAEALELLPDEMTFWIYNDSGGPHTESNGSTAIQMEIQVQSFAYATNDEINDMTFQRYKLINRAPQDIRDMYFAMWVDADLGCSEDDFAGCDVERSLAYTYNQDAADGDSGTSCSTLPGPTYGTNIPIVGVDYFRGPLGPKRFATDEDGNVLLDSLGEKILLPVLNIGAEVIDTFTELGMSSFIYINRQAPDAWTLDPQTAPEYYNYLQGNWRDGRALTNGGCGYGSGSTDTIRYVFPGVPENDDTWSQCSQCNVDADRRTLQASGPFLLTPGAVNELIIGVVWVPDLDYPCPDISKLQAADDLAQGLFNNCFNLLDGPDAPDVCAIELDKEVILVLTNDTIASNNAFEEYNEIDPFAPQTFDDIDYEFEGYLIYQLINAQVSPSEYGDIDKARLVQRVDVQNGVREIYNWAPISLSGYEDELWQPTLEVEGTDSGIRHTFQITEDQFASGNRALVNHKKYYFSVLAYAHNEWQQFDPNPEQGQLLGQRRAYLEGRNNIEVYTVIPRPIVYDELNSGYGDGAVITRLSGVGIGGNFVDLAEGEYELILNGTNDGRVTYAQGAGPFEIAIYNPLEVRDGTYKLKVNAVHNSVGSVCSFEPGATWELTADDGTVVFSERSLDELNEQIISQFGFSISMAQTDEAGAQIDELNGAIGATTDYSDINGVNWFSAITDDGFGIPLIDETPFFRPLANFLKTGTDEVDNGLDPESAFSSVGQGFFYPFFLASSAPPTPTDAFPYYLTPAWNQQGFIRNNNGLYNLNNVDIVFTNDKSKWSRCVVVETNNQFFFNNGFRPIGDATTDNFDLRQSPSVDQNGIEDGDGIGMGWFPGYAVDVETGKRLNIFFGENSYYNEDYAAESDMWTDLGIGADMLFNPNDELIAFDTIQGFGAPRTVYSGAHHFIYTTRQEYDGCQSIREKITESTSPANLIGKREVLLNVTWCSMALANEEVMLSYEDGYIPNDLTVKLRVDNPYNLENEFSYVPNQCNPIGGFPEYEFTIEGREKRSLTEDEYEGALANVNVVPNPYYGYSAYETSQFTTTVKITNLPAKADINIYTLDGKFVKQFRRDESDPVKAGSNPGIQRGQGIPDIEWDLKNFNGIPIASGVYLIHVVAPDLGEERTLKWFGVNRKFDASGL